jgi:hypothetical protein
MKTKDAIAALGTAMGLPALALDTENTCSLMIDDRQEVYLSGDPDGNILRLHAVLGDMAALRADPELMLEVNYNATESGGGALSINRMTAEVVYVKTLDLAGLDAAGVTAALEHFIGYATFWLENIGTLTASDAGDPAAGVGALDETIIRV